jgi:hypothetical protein
MGCLLVVQFQNFDGSSALRALQAKVFNAKYAEDSQRAQRTTREGLRLHHYRMPRCFRPAQNGHPFSTHGERLSRADRCSHTACGTISAGRFETVARLSSQFTVVSVIGSRW